MKFLLNMNVPRGLRGIFAAHGHSCRHAGDVGLARASDVEVMEAARATGEVIVTHDLDYGHLLAFSGETGPSVIIFRLPHGRVQDLLVRLFSVWKEVEGPLEQGAIVVLGPASLRIRPLPVSEGPTRAP